jgi:hypothetical protein
LLGFRCCPHFLSLSNFQYCLLLLIFNLFCLHNCPCLWLAVCCGCGCGCRHEHTQTALRICFFCAFEQA